MTEGRPAYAVPKPGTARAATWARCGVARLKLLSPEPVKGLFYRTMSRDAKGRAKCIVGGEATFYRADVSAIAPGALDQILGWCAMRFDVPLEELRTWAADPAHGLPIVANDDIEVVREEDER